MAQQHEKELLERIRSDPHAFVELYDHYYLPIFSYVLRRVGDYDLAKDVTAETFLKAYQKINFFTWRNIPVSAWLYRIASNEINQLHRRRRSSTFQGEFVYEEGIETEKQALEKAFAENQDFMAVQRLLAKLDSKYAEVIALRYFEEKSVKEIADIVGKKEGTVKSLLSRGLEKLRREFEKIR